MFQFILDNKEWIFSGIGVAVIGVLITILRRKSPESPQVMVHVSNTDKTQSEDIQSVDVSHVSIERISPITFKDIQKAIDEATPFQRQQVGKNFIGIMVEWDGFLSHVYDAQDDMVKLMLTTEKKMSLSAIHCEVPLNQYREISVLPEGTRIRIQGKIETAERYHVYLTDARLFFYGD